MFKHNEQLAKAIAAHLEFGDYTRLLIMISECALYNTEHGYFTSAKEAQELFDLLYDYAKQNGHYK